MITTGNLSFHLKKNSRTFATIAVLSGTALASIAGSASVQSFTLGLAHSANPTTYAIDDEYYNEFKTFLKEEEAEISGEEYVAFKYVGGKISYSLGYEEGKRYVDNESMINVISMSNYEKTREVIPEIKEIILSNEKDIAVLGGSNNAYVEDMLAYDETGILGNIGEVKIVEKSVDNIGNTRDMRLNGQTVIVTDELYKNLDATYQYGYHVIEITDGDKNETLSNATEEKFASLIDKKDYFIATTTIENNKAKDSFTAIKEPLETEKSKGYTVKNAFSMRYPYYNGLIKNTGLLIYVAVFLGMVFMIATGSIITLKQLSEAEDESVRYDMLRKIGTPKNMIKKSIYKQNFTVFFVPLSISLFHAYFALRVLFVLIEVPSLTLTLISVVFLIIIYILFYFATSSSYNKIVNS